MDEQLTKQEKRRKILWEIKDIFAGVAFPLIVLVIFSSTIIAYAFTGIDDLTVKILAVGGGELLIIIAYIIFGRQNGATAYRKFVLNDKKRAIGSDDKQSIYKTGEYAIWKGALIGFLTTVPFIIFQIINICYENSFCTFILQYACGWAFFPSRLLGAHQAVNLALALLPTGVHLIGYILGRYKEEKIQNKISEESGKLKKDKRAKLDEDEFFDPLDEEYINSKKGKRRK